MRAFRLALILGLVLTVSPVSIPVQASTNLAQPGVNIVSETDRDITLSYTLPGYQVKTQVTSLGECQEVNVPGADLSSEPGEASLPAMAILVGVPAQRTIRLEILQADYQEIPGTYQLCTDQLMPPKIDVAGVIETAEPERVKTVYQAAQTNYLPGSSAEILQNGFIRNQAVIQLAIYPAQYLPPQETIRVLTALEVRLSWDPILDLADDNPSAVVSGLDPLISASIINPEQADTWLTTHQAGASLQLQAEGQDVLPPYKFLIPSSGLYSLSGSDLQAAGVPIDQIRDQNLHVWYKGAEVPIIVERQSQTEFQVNDRIIFYGFLENSLYVNANTFQLSWDSRTSLQMNMRTAPTPGLANSQGAFTDRQRFNEDRIYVGAFGSGTERDHWYWSGIVASGTSASVPFTVHLGDISTAEEDVLLRGLIQGYTANPMHHTRIYINGHLIDEAYWDARSEYSLMAYFPTTYLVSGDNTITVESVMDSSTSNSLMYVNWFEIEYPRVLIAENNQIVFTMPTGQNQYAVSGFSQDQLRVVDITDPLSPCLVQGFTVQEQAGTYTIFLEQNLPEPHTFLVQTESSTLHPSAIQASITDDLKSSDNGADYVIITHPTLVAASQALADYRAAQGLRSRVVDLQAIYDQFGYGLPDPNAIRDFLRYAYLNWQAPAPLYVLLMGDGNYDYKNNGGYNEINYVPPLLYEIDPWINQTSADNRYAAIIGEDILPDLYIGRLPVKSVQEVQAVINKITTYESLPAENWNRQALLIADNNDGSNDFVASSNHLAGLLPEEYSVSRVHYGVTHTTVDSARARIFGDINAGQGLVQYVGHGAYSSWAGERLLTYADVPSLTNANRLSFVLSLDCMDGYFLFPSKSRDLSALAEGLVRSANGGAIATFSPAGYGLVEGHDLLATGLYEAIFQYGMKRAGAATTYAKYYLASHTAGHRELIDTFTLFGDPALQLKLGPTSSTPQADLRVQFSLPEGRGEPGEWVTVQVDYANIGQVPADGITLSLPLPAQLLDASVTADPVIAQHNGSSYSWVLSSLTPGASGQILLRARIDPAYIGEFPLTAQIHSLAADADQTNNEATTLLSVNPADVSVTLHLLSPFRPAPGDQVEIRLDYLNQGIEANNLLLSLVPPPELLDVIVILPAGWTEQTGAPLTWSMSSLPAGGSGSIVIQGRLAPERGGSFPLQASLGSDSFEVNQADNTATLLIGSYFRWYFPQIFRGQ